MKSMRVWMSRAENLMVRTGCPWYPGRFPDGAMGRLHRVAVRQTFVMRFGRWAWLPKLVLTVSWPVRLAFQTWRQFRLFGKLAAELNDVSWQRQWMDLIVLGCAYGLPPLAYYRYRLFLPENRAQLGDYVYDHEIQSLFPYFNGYRIDPAVDDKRLFAERCTDANLACATTLAWGDGGKVRWVQDVWPPCDLVSKPISGYRGEGVVLWRRSEAGYCPVGSATPLGQMELLQYLSSAPTGQAWLLQPMLLNHPLIADLSPAPLITLRLVTAYDGRGNAGVIAAVLKMPVGHQLINNHGIGSAVDLCSGVLGLAFPYRSLHPGFECHPTTGAQVAGRILPDWDDAKRLALSAHRHFPSMLMLGWDIALTATGPVLLEANVGWDVAMPQIALQMPLGLTAFVDFVPNE